MAIAITASAVVGAGASIASSATQANAADNAAAARERANKANISYQENIFNKQRADFQPFREAGVNELPKFSSGVNSGTYLPPKFNFNFQKDPGYDFRFQQGMDALDTTAANNANIFSGKHVKDAETYGQNFASNEYNNAFQRYVTNYNADADRSNTKFNQGAALVDIGRGANNSINQARQQLGTNVGNSIINSGNAEAQGQIAVGNAVAGGIQGVAGAAQKAGQNYLFANYQGMM